MAKPSVGYSANEDFYARHVRPKPGRTLVAGSRLYRWPTDRRQRFANVEGWDAIDGEGVDRVVDLEFELPSDAGLFDHIECHSVLEHSRRPWLLAANLERLLAPAGTLYVAVPFIWRVHAYPSDFWRFTVDGVRELFPSIEWAKMMYASIDLTEDVKARGVKVREHPYFARTEVCAFGTKR